MHYIIVGTDHPLQASTSPDTGLRDLLQSIVDDSVVLIAEEVPTSYEIHTFGRELIGKDKWLSIDMEKQRQIDQNIYYIRNSSRPEKDPITGAHIWVNAYHKRAEAVREHYWLDNNAQECEQRNISTGTVVLICGDNHTKFVAQKLIARGHTVAHEQYLPFNKEERFGPFWVYDD